MDFHFENNACKKQRDKNMKVSESLLFKMTFKNQWHYLDFQSYCISFSSLLVLTTDYWVVMRPKRTIRTESEPTMKRETGNHLHLDNLSSCGIPKKDINITKHPSVLLFALEHFLWINGEKVFEVYKGSTFCNGSKFGVFICHSRPATHEPHHQGHLICPQHLSQTHSVVV